MRNLFALLALACLASAADAKWKPEYGAASPEVQAWYRQQHNSRGEWCCNESDGHPFFGDYKFNEDGSVTLDIGDGKTRTLPEHMVLKGANPTGHAVWWFLDVNEGSHRDYCFAPGTLG